MGTEYLPSPPLPRKSAEDRSSPERPASSTTWFRSWPRRPPNWPCHCSRFFCMSSTWEFTRAAMPWASVATVLAWAIFSLVSSAAGRRWAQQGLGKNHSGSMSPSPSTTPAMGTPGSIDHVSHTHSSVQSKLVVGSPPDAPSSSEVPPTTWATVISQAFAQASETQVQLTPGQTASSFALSPL